MKDKILEIKARAEKQLAEWNYPNEHYIEATGALMVCNELLESAELSQLIDLRKELIEFCQWYYKISHGFAITDKDIDEYLKFRSDSKAVTDEIRQPDLTCDVCGRHPAVIVQTQFGRYCMKHARYV